MPETSKMDRNLALEAVRVTEAAALSASRLMGRGDEKAADQAAVDAMREALNSLSIAGTVVIGEGERDEAPMLYIGEKVGTGNGPPIDIALDPLEGTTITAKGGANALAVIAMADAGGFLNAPDVYMDKIAVGGGLPDDLVDLDEPPGVNLKNLAKAKKVEVADLVVCILDRPRHAELIAKVREAGARIALISDGDVSGVIATSEPETGIDMYVGSGGAPEGVLGGCCSATMTSAAAPTASALPTSTANTSCSISLRATSCSRRPVSRTARCCEACAALPAAPRRIPSSCVRNPALSAMSRRATISRANKVLRRSPAEPPCPRFSSNRPTSSFPRKRESTSVKYLQRMPWTPACAGVTISTGIICIRARI